MACAGGDYARNRVWRVEKPWPGAGTANGGQMARGSSRGVADARPGAGGELTPGGGGCGTWCWRWGPVGAGGGRWCWRWWSVGAGPPSLPGAQRWSGAGRCSGVMFRECAGGTRTTRTLQLPRYTRPQFPCNCGLVYSGSLNVRVLQVPPAHSLVMLHCIVR